MVWYWRIGSRSAPLKNERMVWNWINKDEIIRGLKNPRYVDKLKMFIFIYGTETDLSSHTVHIIYLEWKRTSNEGRAGWRKRGSRKNAEGWFHVP